MCSLRKFPESQQKLWLWWSMTYCTDLHFGLLHIVPNKGSLGEIMFWITLLVNQDLLLHMSYKSLVPKMKKNQDNAESCLVYNFSSL